MKKLIILPILTILLLTNNLYSQVTQEWVQRYNGPANNYDDPKSIAVDGSGNVYVTGSSYGIGTNVDYATIKYNSSGDIMWKARYNGPDNNTDQASSIAVDGSGNVYVTGRSIKSGSNFDFVTIKYNTWGVQQWLARYDQFSTANDEARSIAVDGLGNVYVTGLTGIGTSTDFATVKYDASGVEQWVKIYNGPGNDYDAAASIAVDGSGNVYVTGQRDGFSTTSDYATIKYDASGVEQWVKVYNGSANQRDQPTSLAVDVSGNIYITGFSTEIGTGCVYATIKYDASGVLQWISRYNGLSVNYDVAYSLAVDASGNVYVTGVSYNTGTTDDYATIKYDASGVEQWVSRYNGSANSFDMAYSLAVDGSGNVYVTGHSTEIVTGNDYATIKYNSSGVQQWIQRYDGPVGHEHATSIAVDGSGNVYVTGSSFGIGTSRDFATIKYSQAGKKLEKGITELPSNYSLEQNYPNPFNPSTTIIFSLPVEGNVVISVSDITGKEISKLIDQKMSAGYHEVNFDGSNLSSGIYFYKIKTSGFTDVKKMIIVK